MQHILYLLIFFVCTWVTSHNERRDEAESVFLYFEDKSKQKFYHKVHSIASPEVHLPVELLTTANNTTTRQF